MGAAATHITDGGPTTDGDADGTVEATFAAMGSDAHIIIVGGPGDAMVRAQDRVAELGKTAKRA